MEEDEEESDNNFDSRRDKVATTIMIKTVISKTSQKKIKESGVT